MSKRQIHKAHRDRIEGWRKDAEGLSYEEAMQALDLLLQRLWLEALHEQQVQPALEALEIRHRQRLRVTSCRSHQKRNADKKYMQQGLINNSTAKGMKHYKNQSLTF